MQIRQSYARRHTRPHNTNLPIPWVMATLRNLAISLLYLAGVKQVNRTLQAIARDRTRLLDYLPL